MQNNGYQKYDCDPIQPREMTKGVSLLTGDPKKAILKLSGPMVVAMLMLSIYNLADAIWVSGLGPDALAAVGFIMPVFMILIGISNGLGAGVSSAIARKIGAQDKAGADNTAAHAMLFVIILSVALTFPLMLFVKPLVMLLGAGSAGDLAATYGEIVFGGTIFIIFTNIAYSVLRGEGDTKRTMYAMGGSAIVNLILDPILIYHAKMGVAGAAWATVISILLVSAVLLYWLLIKKDTYVSLSRKTFSLDRAVIKDVLQVGLPAGLEFLLISIVAVIINGILVTVSGTDAVAVYTAGWRVVMFAIIPMVAIGTSTVSVVGAAFGARRYENLQIIHNYSIRLGLSIGIATSILTWIFAPAITTAFTYSSESAHLAPTMVAFLHTMCFFYPFVPPGIVSASLFQGTGNGKTSLAINIFRSLIFIVLLAFILGIVLGMGEVGVWRGIVIGDILGGILGYLWARLYISRLIKAYGDLWHVPTAI